MRSYFAALSDVRFAALSVGQMVSLLGDVMFPLVVLFAALQSDAGAAQVAVLVGTVYAVRFTTLAGVVLFSGGFLDRLNPVRSAAAADSLRVVALLVLILWWDGGLDVFILLAAATVGACEAVSEPAILVIGPRVVERGGSRPNEERADLAIGLLEALRNVMGVAGPPAAALLLAAVGYRVGLGVCAAVFAVSAVVTLWAGAVSRPTRIDEEPVSPTGASSKIMAADSVAETQDEGGDEDEGALAREALTGLGIM